VEYFFPAFLAKSAGRFHRPLQSEPRRPPAGPDWLHEVKHDGCRILARKQGERGTLWTRRGTDYTDKLLGIAQAVRSLRADEALIDGEAVVFRPDGRSDFSVLMTKRGGAQASFVAFDLERLNRGNLCLRPIEERRIVLLRLVRRSAGRRGRDRVREGLRA
jgi:bifunctional non-homologous end joining protein LigD